MMKRATLGMFVILAGCASEPKAVSVAIPEDVIRREADGRSKSKPVIFEELREVESPTAPEEKIPSKSSKNQNNVAGTGPSGISSASPTKSSASRSEVQGEPNSTSENAPSISTLDDTAESSSPSDSQSSDVAEGAAGESDGETGEQSSASATEGSCRDGACGECGTCQGSGGEGGSSGGESASGDSDSGQSAGEGTGSGDQGESPAGEVATSSGSTEATESVFGEGGGGGSETVAILDSVAGSATTDTERSGSDVEGGNADGTGRPSGSEDTLGAVEQGNVDQTDSFVDPESGSPEADAADSATGDRRDTEIVGSTGEGVSGPDRGELRTGRATGRAGVTGTLAATVDESRDENYLDAAGGEWRELEPATGTERSAAEVLIIDGVIIFEESPIEVPRLEVDSMIESELLDADGSRPTVSFVNAMTGGWEQVDVAVANGGDFAAGGYTWRMLGIDPASGRMTVYQGHGTGGILAGEFDVAFEERSIILSSEELEDPFPRESRGIVALGGAYDAPAVPLPQAMAVMPMGGGIKFGGKNYMRLSAGRFDQLRFGTQDVESNAQADIEIQPSPSGPGAGPREIDFFGIPANAQRICFIVDRSGSMQMNDRIGMVKAHLSEAIRGLRPGTFFEVVFFGGTNQADAIDGSGWGKANRAGKEKFLRAVVGVGATGSGTDPIAAFEYAFNSLSPRPDLVVFLTDGLIQPGIPELLQRLNDGIPPSMINTMAVGEGCNDVLLREIASAHRGKYRRID